MLNRSKLLALAAAIVALCGCTSSKQILYFQDINERTLGKLTNEYEAIIKKDDRLTILVSGADKTVTAPYNLTISELGTTSTSTDPERATLTYLVDSEGNIEFPILGKIHVEGMTRNQLVEYLTTEIGRDVKDPIVYVSFRNYKITVMGEVKVPGTYTFDSEKVNILQALGRAGDLNLTAKRDDIILIREVDGVQTHHVINLKNSDILESPYFYLQQNDVIYVPASPTRIASATAATNLWSAALSAITTTVSVVSLAIVIKNQNK
ncbi:MAG: polysaccharide biosynthesis/export family protein [Bacteroidales bacterium]|nr:polysaccharide biosynthesis/export family protein [Bacteroidales bacterium]